MSFTVTATKSISATGVSETGTVSVSVDAIDNIDVAFTGAVTDQQVIIAFTTSAIKAFYFECDSACVIETNSSSSPADTFTVPADTPFEWITGSLLTNPFGTSVTTLYLTKAASGNHTAKIRVGRDATP